MKYYNYIVFCLLFVLVFFTWYLNYELNAIVIDPMSDGQAGIGIGVLALLLVAIGFVSCLIAIVTGVLLFVKKKNQTRLGKITLTISVLLSLATFVLLVF